MPALVFSPLPALGWELTLPDTYPQAGVVHLGFIPGFSMLPMDMGLVALGMGCAPSWVLGWVQPCSTVSCAGNCSGIPCSPSTFLPAASAVAIWVSVSASAVTTLFLGCLWRGREGSWGGILFFGGWGKQGWRILLPGLARRWVMGCKGMAKLMHGSMWDGMSWRAALPGLSSL